MKKPLKAVLVLLLLAVFGYSVYRIGDYYMEKHRSDVIVREAAQYVRLPQAEDHEPDDLTRPGSAQEGFQVNFNALWVINKDIVGWLYCPDTPINYPVVQAADNEQYLRRLLDGSWNVGGTLFLDYRCASDFTGGNHIIYGHHMKSGAMFGSLVKYRSQSYYDAHPTMYLATPDRVYRVELFAGCTIESADDIYRSDVTEAELEEMIRSSTFRADRDIPIDGPILMLSTCAYDFDNARYVVLGALIADE